jgi:ABC-type branched-subunit amino acid transport system ATPase component
MAGGPATLEVEHLTVRFGGLRAVNDVSLSVPPGAVVGLIGPNGSGKTTTLDAISGFVAPEEGSVRVDGDEIGDLLAEERRSLGVIRSFQDCRLYPDLSVEDVLMVCEDAGRPVSVLGATLQLPLARRSEQRKREAVERVIGAFGLGRFRHHRAAEISTGTRRVVDLASVVLAEPRLLLLDEPTAGIAQREAEAFVPLLQRLRDVADCTILLVEHDVPLVFALCSHVVVMEAGGVVSVGTPDEISRDPRALAAYLGASAEALTPSGTAAVSNGARPGDVNAGGPGHG